MDRLSSRLNENKEVSPVLTVLAQGDTWTKTILQNQEEFFYQKRYVPFLANDRHPVTGTFEITAWLDDVKIERDKVLSRTEPHFFIRHLQSWYRMASGRDTKRMMFFFHKNGKGIGMIEMYRSQVKLRATIDRKEVRDAQNLMWHIKEFGEVQMLAWEPFGDYKPWDSLADYPVYQFEKLKKAGVIKQGPPFTDIVQFKTGKSQFQMYQKGSMSSNPSYGLKGRIKHGGIDGRQPEHGIQTGPGIRKQFYMKFHSELAKLK